MQFKCCGVRQSNIDYSTNPLTFKDTFWKDSTIDPGVNFQARYPPSCCKSLSGSTFPFNKDSESLGIMAKVNWRQCLVEGNPKYTNTISCFESVRDEILKYAQYGLGCATFNSAVQIMSIIAGLRLIRVLPS